MFEVKSVCAGYGGNMVLRDVTLKVPPGAVVALLGANGAGKTTLLRVASGQLRPVSGALRMDGVDVTGWKPHQLVRLGVCHVPEGRGVFPSLTVRENLRLDVRDGSETELLDKVLNVFPSLQRRYAALAGTMSGGEQQMLALARAYIQNPRVCLLDEVSMGLAPVVVDEIFTFLKLLASEGSSLLLVEQYVTRALSIADYVYLLNRGEVRFAGEPPELEASQIFQEYVGADMT